MNSDNRSTLIMIVFVILLAGTVLLLCKPSATANTVTLLQTSNMTCGSCSQQISSALSKHPGVTAVTVDVPASLVEIYFDSRQTTPIALAAQVSTLGFPASVAYVQPLKGGGGSNTAGPAGCNSGGCGNCNKK